MKILFIGDIIGEPGRNTVARLLPQVRSQHDIEMVIANGENAAAGFGITPKIAEDLFELGIDVITSGNHIWDKKEVMEYLGREPRLLRPANYPGGAPGVGSYVWEADSGERVGVLNLSGRVFMTPIDCPFQVGKKEVAKLREKSDIVIVDFHAEATSEKVAFGWYIDGQVTAVIGTHTHVQTADERILPNGTACITDVGMTGPSDSVIGIKTETAIEKFLTGTPKRFEIAKGPTVFNAVVITVDGKYGTAKKIERINIKD
ncbi:MAG: TIGR00282 family metallophosphoesterase [Nitrospirota bacterium]|nr:TIGR00282 family metallophosphoesterase [Nitrospirota bacterium]